MSVGVELEAVGAQVSTHVDTTLPVEFSLGVEGEIGVAVAGGGFLECPCCVVTTWGEVVDDALNSWSVFLLAAADVADVAGAVVELHPA